MHTLCVVRPAPPTVSAPWLPPCLGALWQMLCAREIVIVVVSFICPKSLPTQWCAQLDRKVTTLAIVRLLARHWVGGGSVTTQ